MNIRQREPSLVERFKFECQKQSLPIISKHIMNDSNQMGDELTQIYVIKCVVKIEKGEKPYK